jgi:xanthine dehydrogenase accessory factor
MLDAELQAAAAAWQLAGRVGWWVELVAVRGSAPRSVGAALLVDAAEVLGSIGGGHLEWQAIRLAREGQLGEHRFALGPSLGQCCGGSVRLHITPLADWQPAPPASLTPPRFHLELYGAGHVGRAIVRLLADIPCRVRWIDARLDEPFPAVPAHVQTLYGEGAEPCPDGAHVRVMTHRHDLDLAIAQSLLREGRCASLGVIGSASKAASFRQRLAHLGLDVAALQCPTGLPGIRGKEPAVIAVAVVAELLQLAQAASAKR